MIGELIGFSIIFLFVSVCIVGTIIIIVDREKK